MDSHHELMNRAGARMQFVEGVTWRVSQRGLVLCGPGAAPLLIEHLRAADVPTLVEDATTLDELTDLLGGSETDRVLADDMVAERIIADPTTTDVALDSEPAKRVTLTRSGAEFTGIDSVARAVHRITRPIFGTWPGRLVIVGIVFGGIGSLIVGRPPGPQVTQHPWLDATFGLALGLALAGLHELAHAVTLIHYGRSPRCFGVGFYWGTICFYIDSSDGITLPRRARIVNALAGLAVDMVTASLLLITSHVAAAPVLVVTVFWRIAVLQLVGVVENGLPILEVDGHIALTDYLDEPDLAPRSREALSHRLRGVTQREQPSWLAAYGAFSLIGGIALLASGTWVWWLAAGDLVKALFSGNAAEILLGLYVVMPVIVAALLSAVGLLMELVLSSEPKESIAY